MVLSTLRISDLKFRTSSTSPTAQTFGEHMPNRRSLSADVAFWPSGKTDMMMLIRSEHFQLSASPVSANAHGQKQENFAAGCIHVRMPNGDLTDYFVKGKRMEALDVSGCNVELMVLQVRGGSYGAVYIHGSRYRPA